MKDLILVEFLNLFYAYIHVLSRNTNNSNSASFSILRTFILRLIYTYT